MEVAERLTARNDRMQLVIALNYGGRAEILEAVRALLEDRRRRRVRGERVTERSIARRLHLPDVPDPDLLIRTSGEMRTSNFLLWQAAYAELWFTPVLWPDFNREHLFEAIRDYQKRERRFGGVGG
jgi:undecaprenyl diphosphate synthase